MASADGGLVLDAQAREHALDASGVLLAEVFHGQRAIAFHRIEVQGCQRNDQHESKLDDDGMGNLDRIQFLDPVQHRHVQQVQ